MTIDSLYNKMFEVILTDRDIIHFGEGKTKDDYSFYFLFIFFGIYTPVFNILFIIDYAN